MFKIDSFTMKIKKGDLVKIRIGSNKGKIGKVLSTIPKDRAVRIEGIGLIKRHVKPSQLQPKGGTKDVHIAVPVSKVALITDGKTTTSRVGYAFNKTGEKVRVARQHQNKLVDSPKTKGAK